jgi:SAM-dependent methyltransferase
MEDGMIKRKSRYDVIDFLSDKEWKIADLGSGTRGSCPHANVYLDKEDHSNYFKDKLFIQHDLNNLPFPFENKELDFCWASHVLEHMPDPIAFINEIVRISKSGYIEIPTPLIDNLVSGGDVNDPHGHKWWVFYDDHKEKIILRPRRHIVRPSVTIPELNMLYPWFRSSFVIELYWEDSINIEIGDEKYFYEENEYDLKTANITPWMMGQS